MRWVDILRQVRLQKVGQQIVNILIILSSLIKIYKLKIDKTNEFKSKIRALVLEDPNLIEQRINNTVSELLKIKREFNV